MRKNNSDYNKYTSRSMLFSYNNNTEQLPVYLLDKVKDNNKGDLVSASGEKNKLKKITLSISTHELHANMTDLPTLPEN